MVRILIVILICFPILAISAQTENWKKGILLIVNGNAISGEVSEYPEYYFIRDREKGLKILKSDVIGFIDEHFFRKVKNKSAIGSVFESIILFGSGANYQFISEDKRQSKTYFARAIKISLLLSSLYFLNEVEGQRRKTADSLLFINYDQKYNAFAHARNDFYISAGLLVLATIYYAFDAWYSFGKDERGKDLGIKNSNDIPLDAYIKMRDRNFSENPPQALNNVGGSFKFDFKF
ncbi:hypothetical protein [Leptospira interrogans]|uniref:hypothetical protein n=1 Tax=Leptospira interrogans TaxID=173 RepID=UPI0002B98D51|nr:hypothetical protein [Leptospira interrogans]MCR8648453.1 hypothetical protein [Leptospira interrogans serovar Bataviae]OAM86120.1 hypothetical protein A1343_15930 [Leptospira interrogans serovar Bataviae]QOI40478.1 hypothetical protein Lepto1548_19730 [Leptospira interrogans serovar Bataviae]